jgi:hypothetical protein
MNKRPLAPAKGSKAAVPLSTNVARDLRSTELNEQPMR